MKIILKKHGTIFTDTSENKTNNQTKFELRTVPKSELHVNNATNTRNTINNNTNNIVSNTTNTTVAGTTTKNSSLLNIIVEHPIITWFIALTIIGIIEELFEKKSNTKIKNVNKENNIIEITPTKVETVKPQARITPPTPTNSSYTCPICGSRLQLKTGRYGPFIGCTNYPRCHYTRNVYRNR